VIVPWGAGGESDILARIAVEAANRLVGEPNLQVVTISGQGGVKGAKAGRDARPDGCTLFNVHQSILSSYLTGRADFTWDSLTPVAKMTETPSIIGAGSKVPFDDYKSMQSWAKANPGKLLAGGTLGSTSHFSLLLVQNALGIDMKVISYDGTADRMKALLANTIHIGQVSEATGAKHHEAGRLKLLALNYHTKSDKIPSLKTAREQGFDLSITSDRGFMLPKGTPQAIVDHYVETFKKVAADKKYIAAVEAKGSFVNGVYGKDYEKWFADTMTEWKGIATNLGVYKGS
jgi:tripartite-type tricarboxylate transporter receptor subunit TctC